MNNLTETLHNILGQPDRMNMYRVNGLVCVFSLSISTSNLPPGQTLHLLCAESYFIQSLDVLLYHLYQQLHLKFYSLFYFICVQVYFKKQQMQTSVFGVVCIIFQKSILYITLKIEVIKISIFIFNVIICSVIYWYYMVSHTYLTKQLFTSV